MKKYEEIKSAVYAMRWNGFESMPEFVDFKGDSTNILLRHDESLVVFDNGYNLEQYVVIEKGQWIVKDNNDFIVMSDSEFKKKYKEC